MGPLDGLRIVEIKGLGPGPYAGMLLADMGADVVVVERSSEPGGGLAPPSERDVHSRNKRSIALNLKHPDGVDVLLRLVDRADGLIEGFRPGVAERLGFGPDRCLGRNPGLVYGRVTGWGQDGPLARAAGHDINYIALSGALAAIGGPQRPVLPLNLVGDYAGGSLFLVTGMLAALLAARRTGHGQVVDAAIIDGAASLMSLFHGLSSLGAWQPRRGANLLDGGAPFYDVFETADGRFVAIGAIEPQFFAELLEKLQLDPAELPAQSDFSAWPELKNRLAQVFRQHTRDEWCERLEGTDVCFAPVLDYTEAPQHHHHRGRGTYLEVNGVTQPAPAPRFHGTPCPPPRQGRREGSDTTAILAELGIDADRAESLRKAGVLT